MAVNDRVPGAFDPLDIERFRLRVEVAKLQSERGQTLVNSSLDAQSQWKSDLLDDQIQRLKEESRHKSSSIRGYPYWPW